MKPDQLRVHSLLKDTVTLLCKNGLNFHSVLRIQGVIGITVDDADVFLVHINDEFGNSVDSAGDEHLMAPKSPQRTVGTEVCTKSVSQLRSASMEQKTCIQRQSEEDMVDVGQPVDNSLLFPVEQASKVDESSYFNPSATNSGSLFDFSQAKIEPKLEDGDNDDEVVFLPPEDMPLDSFSQGHYMEQTRPEANSQKWKHDKHQYYARNRELRKQNPTRRGVVTSIKNSPLHVQEYEQNDLTGFSSQRAHQQTMFQPPSSYTSMEGELSSYLNNSYSTHNCVIDSNNSSGDAGVDLMSVDISQRSFFGDSNDDASLGNQNFTTLEVQQRSCRRMVSDQLQRKVGTFHIFYTQNMRTVVVYH